MFLLCCTMVFAYIDNPITYQPSGIFKRHITRWFAAVNPHGDVYILNKRGGLVYRFTPDGKPAGVVGGQGQGPGEYTRPEQIFTDDDQLFIIDQLGKQVLCYHRDGTFKEQFTAPVGMMLERVKDSWIYGNWRIAQNKKEPVTVYFGDDQLMTETAIFSWPRIGGQIEHMFTRVAGKAMKVPYNPVPDFPNMTATFSGDYAYVYQPGPHLRIHVIDLVGKKRNTVIDLPVKPVPFDSDWGTRLMKEEMDLQQKKGYLIKHTADFPEFFPAASLLCTNEKGDLVIGRLVGGNDPMEYLAFDHTGKAATSLYPLKHAYRIIAVHGEHAWISVLKEEQAAVVRVPASEIARAFK